MTEFSSDDEEFCRGDGTAPPALVRKHLHDHPEKLEVIRKWVAALRSGTFLQGKGRLVTERGEGVRQHCCLGVLACMVADKYGLEEKVTTFASYRLVGFGELNENSLVPQIIADDLFMSNVNPLVLLPDSKFPRTLSSLNDNDIPFGTIAYLIESTYLNGEEVTDGSA